MKLQERGDYRFQCLCIAGDENHPELLAAK
jgi:hypothetical protein